MAGSKSQWRSKTFMLIPMKTLMDEFDLQITGIIHGGAHLGEEAATYHEFGVKKVLWIEGNPDLIPELRRNVASYHHDVAQALLGAESGETEFHVANNGQSSSVLELGTHLTVHPDVKFVETKVLPVRTLDSVVGSHWAFGYNFLNLDLQGYELEALRGGEQTLSRVNYVLSEVNVDELYVGCARLGDLDDFLTERGFELVALKMAGSTGWGDGLWRRKTA
jgi:FkbM family methyltransferase